MKCAWEPLLAVLPPKLRCDMEHACSDALQELRLRLDRQPELNLGDRSLWLDTTVSQDDIHFVINAASRYSPWTARTMAKGYLCIPGGHRIGVCGQAVWSGEQVEGFREIDSLCIRIARDVTGIGEKFRTLIGSILILGAPGWGKTTLLRDLARQLSQEHTTVVVDERGELFPRGCGRGKRMDVLSLCPKGEGIQMALRTMGPEVLAVDEITAAEDCLTLGQAANCGVRLLATAHASSIQDLRSRVVYRPLLEQRIFENVILLQKDKSCRAERMFL